MMNQKVLKKFLRIASEELTGEWVLIGGTVLPALGIDYRATTDIDFICLEENQRRDLLKLMHIAEKLGSINQAGAYFLEKISDYKNNLVLLQKTNKLKIYRPNITLYIQLKIARMSEADLSDCLQMLQYTKNNHEKYSVAKLEKIVSSEVQKTDNHAKVLRLKELLRVVEFSMTK